MLKDLLVKNMIIYLSMLYLQKDNDVFFQFLETQFSSVT